MGGPENDEGFSVLRGKMSKPTTIGATGPEF